MNTFLLFCFVSLCFSPVLAFAIGCVLWISRKAEPRIAGDFGLWWSDVFHPADRTPPPVPGKGVL